MDIFSHFIHSLHSLAARAKMSDNRPYLLFWGLLGCPQVDKKFMFTSGNCPLRKLKKKKKKEIHDLE